MPPSTCGARGSSPGYAILLEPTREPAPRPARLDEKPSWCDLADTATELFGRWVEPTTLREAVDRLRELTALQQGRKAVNGRAFARIAEHGLVRHAGGDSLDELATRGLGLSLRTSGRYRKLGPDLPALPGDRGRASRNLIPVIMSWVAQVP